MNNAICETEMAGVFVEFIDEVGNTVGQAVFADWPASRLPAIGDRLSCQARSTTTGRSETRIGRVADRYFEVQEDDDGRPCLWVRLDVTTLTPASRSCRPTSTRCGSFSTN